MADIRINDLPADTTPATVDNIAIDGLTTRRATVEEIVVAGRPTASQAEAEAGTDAFKVMTPLTVKQSIDVNAATAAQGALAESALQPGNIGGTVQGYYPALQSMGSGGITADRMYYATGTNVLSTTALTPFARTLLDDANQAAALSTLGAATAAQGALAATALQPSAVGTTISGWLFPALNATTASPQPGYAGAGKIGYTSYTTGSTGFPFSQGGVFSFPGSTNGRGFDIAIPNGGGTIWWRGYDTSLNPLSWYRVLTTADGIANVTVTTPEQFDPNAGTGGNDNAAVQAALDVGGIVVMTRPYITTTTMNVTQNGTTIIGYGGSISLVTSSLVDVMLIRERSNCNVFGLEINGRRDLKSASGQSDTRGITMFSCVNVNIKDCYVHDTLEHGIRSGNDGDSPIVVSRHINIENNRVENCGNTTPRRGYGIWLFSENHDCKVVGNKVRNCVAGGIAADDVSDTQTPGLENERVIIGYNLVYNSAFDPNTGNSIGIWVGGSQNITVVGNNVRGYRNGIMLEDSQANSLNAWVTVTGNNVEAGPVGIMVRNSAFSVISGNTIKANKPPSGSFSGEATGILIYGYDEVAGSRRTNNILVQGNMIYTERRGISFVNPSYHTPIAGGVTGVSIRGNHLVHFGSVATNDNAIEINDGGVSNYVQDIVVEGNTAEGFYIGYRYSSGITTQGIFQRNTAQNCTVAGFNITANGQFLIGNTTRDNAAGILFGANNASIVVKDHTFQADTANTSGSNGSVTKLNNYPVI